MASQILRFFKIENIKLMTNNPQKIESRMAFAATHTWKNSVKAIYDSIEKVKPSL
jgi:GTP cyclohydrolase II